MRTLFKSLFYLALLAVLLGGALALFAIAEEPLVDGQRRLSHEDIARAEALLRAHDPRGLPAGTRRVVSLDAGDLDLAVNYLVQKFADGQAEVATGVDVMTLRASFGVPLLAAARHINLDLRIGARGRDISVEQFRLGDIAVPAGLTTLAGEALVRALLGPRANALLAAVSDVEFNPQGLRIAYQWDPQLIDQARDSLLAVDDRDALRFYLDELLALQARGIGTHGDLIALLGPLFDTAGARSRERDPVAENTALLTVLGTWASGRNLARLVPGSQRPGYFRLHLLGRRDFAQHFLTSAALAARGDSTLSDAVGLFKEMADADRGSGFSFTDIAADRTGTRFGEIATRSQDSARYVQRRIAAGVVDADLMPRAADLPEHLDGDAFRRQFGQVGSPEYRALMDEIERRIDRIPLYRG
jgi:hypothetical protein